MNDHARKLLGIYLNDHLAALVAARELARRASAGATDDAAQACGSLQICLFKPLSGAREIERAKNAAQAAQYGISREAERFSNARATVGERSAERSERSFEDYPVRGQRPLRREQSATS